MKTELNIGDCNGYPPRLQVWSCGGGTQSCAIAALICTGKLPIPDYAVIADTGWEMPTTWSYFIEVLQPNLARVGCNLQRIYTSQLANNWGRGIFAASGQLMLPAFSNKSGDPSKLPAFCSGAWKAEVVDKWLRNRGIIRRKYVKWIGFSSDETRRIIRMKKGPDYAQGLIHFPLELTRQEGIELVKSLGWPSPPRSRCYICPNQSDLEWSEVKRLFPMAFSHAVSLDRIIRERDPHAFLHSSLTPLGVAKIIANDYTFSGACPEGECFL